MNTRQKQRVPYRSMGEPWEDIGNGILHSRKLTFEQAAGMLMLLALRHTSLLGIRLRVVDKSLATKCAHADSQRREIVLYRGGLNEKTLLHEIAHFLAGCGHGHDDVFKERMREVCAWWRERQGV